MSGGGHLAACYKGFENLCSLFLPHDTRYSGFTLAEVLVTLGIIGVVSAMTIPTLIQNHQRKVYVTQLHKIYNELQQAAILYQTERNAINLKEAGLTSADALDSFVKSTFKVIQDCGETSTPCMAPNSEYKKINGQAADGTSLAYFVTIASGASLGYDTSTAAALGYDNIVAIFDVDINGAKGPNIAGRDLFVMALYNNGAIDDIGPSAPLSKDERETLFTSKCKAADGSWYGCFGKILNDNWEMTY